MRIKSTKRKRSENWFAFDIFVENPDGGDAAYHYLETLEEAVRVMECGGYVSCYIRRINVYFYP